MTEPSSISAPDSQKWALLIGINKYPRLSERYHLKGCINDVNAIEELLTSPQFAFPPQNLLKLTSPAPDPLFLPTRENILAAFARHLAGNDRILMGDIVVIYYSGHGSQIPDEEGDEEDGYDETIVPCDAGPDRGKRKDVLDISDDEISAMLDELAKRTKNINLFFDSCHSGTVTRALPDTQSGDAQGRERYLPRATYPITQPVRRAATRSMGPSDWMPLSDGYVLISSCMADERAREDRFGFLRRKHHGIMSYYLLQAMKDVGPETAYLDIWDDVRVKITKHNRWQNPQIEGAFERKVFGGAALPRKRYVEVTGRTRDEVTLAVGLANGATAGSRFAIYSRGVQVFDDQSSRVAVIRLTRIDAFHSVGTIEDGSVEEIEVGAPAIEIEHDFGDMRMWVDIVGDTPLMKAMREQISGSNLLSVWESHAAEVPTARVRLRYPFDERGNEVTGEGEKLFVLSAGDGHPLVEPIAPDGNSPVIVKGKLEHIAAYYNVLAIRNPDQQSRLKDKIKLRLLKVVGQDENNRNLVEPVERNAGGDIVLKVGERVILEAKNESDQPLYLVILDCDSSWGVTPIFPESGAPDSMVGVMATRQVSHLTVNLPDYQKPVKKNQPLPREIVKAIATTARVEFRFLWQPSTRSFEDERTSIHKLVKRAVGISEGRVTRSLEKDDDPVVADWTTAELIFHIIT
jgi:hypothetical protein